MIEVINGSIIYNNGEFTKSYAAGQSFEADHELEMQWVNDGFAKFIGPSLGEDEKSDEPGEPAGLYNDSTKFDELKEIAIKLGATDEDLKGKNSKDKLKALIDELVAPQDEIGEESDEDSEGEGAPEGEEAPAEDGEEDGPDFGEDDGVVE